MDCKKDVEIISSFFNRTSINIDEYYDKSIKKNQILPNDDNLYLFLSFDICNSTQLKTVYDNWKDSILDLYDREKIESLVKWKHIGDEVVYVGEYTGFKQLLEIIDAAYSYMETKETEFSKIVTAGEKEKRASITFKLKATIWLAKISEAAEEPTDSVRLNDIDEFIGTYIDEGFRMATKSSDNKLLIDPKIVYIILFFYCFRGYHLFSDENNTKKFIDVFIDNHVGNNVQTKNEIAKAVYSLIEKDFVASPRETTSLITKYLKNIHFLSFTPLKGIWNGKPYPIFWFFKDASSFKYYETETMNQYPVSIYDAMKETSENVMCYSSRDLIKVFETVGVSDNIKDIIDTILKRKTPKKISYVKKPISNFYYTVACIKDEKVLVLRRKPSRRHLGNVWEFYVSKHTNIDTRDDITNSILNSFGISVKIIDDNTEEKNIFPLHFCTVYRGPKKHNSILCCAEIKDDESIEDILKKINSKLKSHVESKYIEAKFIGLQELKEDFNTFSSLSQQIISYDAEKADTDDSFPFIAEKNFSTMYFKDSIKAVITFYQKYKQLCNNDSLNWWKLFDSKQ